MKGLELPVNILVVIAVAVIVLLGVTALYLAGFTPFGTSVSMQSAWNSACQTVTTNCAYYDEIDKLKEIGTSVDTRADGKNDNLLELCEYQHKAGADGATDEQKLVSCRRACGCPN